MLKLPKEEASVLKSLSTPNKIQDFLDTLAFNYEKNGETCMPPCMVLRTGKAHCLEGALFAATALWYHGERPLLLNLETIDHDDDHALALYKKTDFGVHSVKRTTTFCVSETPYIVRYTSLYSPIFMNTF